MTIHTLSAMITLNEMGEIIGTRIEPSVIKSRVKGIYSEISEIYRQNLNKWYIELWKERTWTREK